MIIVIVTAAHFQRGKHHSSQLAPEGRVSMLLVQVFSALKGTSGFSGLYKWTFSFSFSFFFGFVEELDPSRTRSIHSH